MEEEGQYSDNQNLPVWLWLAASFQRKKETMGYSNKNSDYKSERNMFSEAKGEIYMKEAKCETHRLSIRKGTICDSLNPYLYILIISYYYIISIHHHLVPHIFPKGIGHYRSQKSGKFPNFAFTQVYEKQITFFLNLSLLNWFIK